MTPEPVAHRPAAFEPPGAAPPRVVLARPAPGVDGTRYAPKRTVGDRVALSVDVLRDGHEVLRAEALIRPPGHTEPDVVEMAHLDAGSLGVRWGGVTVVDRPGRWSWNVRAWADPLASWRVELARKSEAGEPDLSSELTEGAALLAASAERAGDDGTRSSLMLAQVISRASTAVADAGLSQAERVRTALDEDLAAACDRYPDRSKAVTLAAPMTIDVDRALARFGAWYELFPRSWGDFEGLRRRLPAMAELGFDVIYLPPVSPIGLTRRKGANNALVAGPEDPGSPWAIGDPTGGHEAVHTDLGTVAQFEALVADARDLGMEIALDLAVQCSADHPWLSEHPEWFAHRPDGTLKYAENPPKKYQDIYNVDFDCADWRGLWAALRDVVLTWVQRGVTVFRVDNPHTKPLPFWEWLIAGVRADHPEVLFLAEAFTYRAMQQELGRIGFSQGYTYFTWKRSAHELREYVSELAGDEAEIFRPNFFVNTPDILTEQLQSGGPAMFVSRLILAATLSPTYGIYSGFESLEHQSVRPGSEEYLDSEKYEVKDRRLDGPLLPLVAQLNQIRRRRPPFAHLGGIRFLDTEGQQLLAFAKQMPWSADPEPAGQGERSREGTGPPDTVIVVVLLHCDSAHEGVCIVPDDLGLAPEFTVLDELTGERFAWHTGRNYVRLDPGPRPAHIFTVVSP